MGSIVLLCKPSNFDIQVTNCIGHTVRFDDFDGTLIVFKCRSGRTKRTTDGSTELAQQLGFEDALEKSNNLRSCRM